MTRRFVDTFYFLAMLNPRDAWHDRVVAFQRSVEGRMVTTDAVLIEIANALGRGGLREMAADLIATVRNSSDYAVVSVNDLLFERSLALYRAHSDKSWSLTDCISFIVMAESGITEALTHDRHFEQAGFRRMFGAAK